MTLIGLSNGSNVDTGAQEYTASWQTDDGLRVDKLTREQFLSYAGMVGRTFSAGMKAVA